VPDFNQGDVGRAILPVCPQIHLFARKLRPIVAGNPLWQSTVVLQVIHRSGNVLSAKTETNLNAKTLTRIEIHNRQRPDVAAIGERIRNEVHAPNIIRSH
jgi:hypothetical protein